MPLQTLITAHSGSDGFPDNSLAYVDYALSAGADALEVDVRRGPEGTLLLGHDEAARGAPALREAMDRLAARPGVLLNCDLKEPGLEEDVCALARDCRLGGRILLTGTVDAALFARSPALRETARVFLNMEEYVPDLYLSYREIPDFELRAAEQILSVCGRYGIRTVNVNHILVTRRLIETLSAGGVDLSVWTVNEEENLRWFLAKGVRSVTTRRLKLALSLREGAGD